MGKGQQRKETKGKPKKEAPKPVETKKAAPKK